MKKQLILWLTAITLILSACVDDKYAESSRTPMQFTVSIDDNRATTRSNTVNDTWTNGDPVAIQITSGTSTVVKKYKIDNSASPIKLVPDVGVEPFYWPHSGSTSVTISAWYPYSATRPEASTSNTAITDQSTAEKYEAANLMEAADVIRAYNAETPTNPFHLTFTHRMAKLIIVPYHYQDAKGNNSSQLIETEVAKTTAKAINLCSGENEITAFRNGRQFEVLVAPQTITAGTNIFKLSYTNSQTTRTQVFKYPQTPELTLVAGKTYTYNVNFNTAADSTFTVTTTEPNTLTYNGSSQDFTSYKSISSVTCNGKVLTPDTDYEITGATSATNAGTYTVTVKGKGQYSTNNTSNFDWIINKKDGTLIRPVARDTPGANEELIDPGTFMDGVEIVGSITYQLTTSNTSYGSTWSSEVPTAPTTEGGTHNYYVWYKVEPNSNYELSSGDASDFTAGVVRSPIDVTVTYPN